MKHTILSLMAVIALSMAACQGNATTEPTGIATDSMTYADSSRTAEVTVTADIPTQGPAALTNIIREFINEELGGTYRGSLDDMQAVLAHYGKAMKDTLENMSTADEREDAPHLYAMKTVRKTYETDKYVVYTSCSETYYGGAHGMHTAWATTFRKADGRRFGPEMFIKTESDGFHKLIKDGLKEYFEQDKGSPLTDEELKDALLTDSPVDWLPLPQFAPVLGKDGVVFSYQPYEIAPYAAGMPSFTVPYDRIKPYLTATVLDLIE